MTSFEDYRQPWETGPHWELKREFLERYQDVFPLDRLLCLAQAYSNIELLQCSYPAPVMIQINELSKSLKESKRFRRNETSNDGNDNTASGKKDKRSLDDAENERKYKLIKFCSSEDNTEKDLECSTNIDLKRNFETSMTMDDKKGFGSMSSYTSQENLELRTDFIKSENSFPLEKINFNYSLIAHSPDIKMIKKLALKVQQILLLKKEKPIDAIQSAALLLAMKNYINFRYSKQLDTNTYLSSFSVGTTCISLGEGNDEVSAKAKAAELGLNILKNFKDLPIKSFEEVQKGNQTSSSNSTEMNKNLPKTSICDNEDSSNHIDSQYDKLFLQGFAEKFKNIYERNRQTVAALNETARHLNCINTFVFDIVEDMSTPQHNRLFTCNITLKNISISQSKANSKKKARTEAAEKAVEFLLNLLKSDGKSNSINSQCFETASVKDCNINKINISVSTMKNTSATSINVDNVQNFKNPNISNEINSSVNKNISNTSYSNQSAGHIKSKFVLNKKLFNNSIQKEFVLFDRMYDISDHKARSILTLSSQQCHKGNIMYNVDATKPGNYRTDIVLKDQILGTGNGPTKDASKDEAALFALKKLQKEVYTVKIKTMEEDIYIINRNEMLEFSPETSDVVSENNIGCKMLRMMGWSGGGIGKKEGILEPVSLKDHSFGSGLGYGNKSNNTASMPQFKFKVETLLKEFCQSNSFGALVFSPEFTKSERKEIHRIATKFNINHSSIGKNDDRQLCLRRKFTIPELLNYLLKEGGSTSKYELIDLSS